MAKAVGTSLGYHKKKTFSNLWYLLQMRSFAAWKQTGSNGSKSSGVPEAVPMARIPSRTGKNIVDLVS